MTNPFDSARTAGLDSLVSIPLAVVPTALEWRLLDEAEVQVLDWATLAVDPLAPPATVSLTVPGSANLTAPGEVFGIRTVELRVTHAGGQLVLSSTYAIELAQKLIPMVNSYGTMNQLLIASQYAPESEVMHLTGASPDDRARALLGSYLAIEALPLMVVTDKGQELGWLRDMDAATRAVKIEPQMRRALLMAQILDASNMLGLPADAVTQARMKGMVSMTVGESSQYFGNSRPLEMPLSRAAMRTLARYLRRNTRIGRA